MIICNFAPLLLGAIGESMEVQLPKKGLKLDPRVSDPPHVRFDIRYHNDGITVTLTRMNDVYRYRDVSKEEFSMRAYDPETETVPDFTSTIYMYWGLPREYAPKDTTKVIIHPSVKIIEGYAFSKCAKLRRVIMNENVEKIERNAFVGCRSLDAVFLPSSIKKICYHAFYCCTNLRILSIPQSINIEDVGDMIVHNCHTFFHVTQIPPYEFNGNGSIIINDQVNQAIVDFNHNLPPLHKVCLSTNVTAQSIYQCIDTHGTVAAYNVDYGDGMTPMHIIALNPHADTSSIMTCFKANMGAALEPYSNRKDNYCPSALNGKMPLDYLAEYDVESHLSIVASLCRYREAHSATISSVTLTRDESTMMRGGK